MGGGERWCLVSKSELKLYLEGRSQKGGIIGRVKMSQGGGGGRHMRGKLKMATGERREI